ncbi:FHA domain-containing protein, partial [Thermodesulfobacteriota bacterium]
LSNIPVAIEKALYELKINGHVDARKVIILLTDGIVDTGEKAQNFKKENWLKEDLAKDSRKNGVRIFGIAFTDQADFSLIQTLAVRTDGEYFRALQVEDIGNIFTKFQEIINKSSPAPTPPVATPLKASTPQPLSSPASDSEAPLKTPAASSVSTAPATTPTPEGKTKPAWVAFIILVGVVVVLLFIYPGHKPLKQRLRIVARMGRFKGIASQIPRAELVDVKNITGNKTLRMDQQILKIGRDTNNELVIPMDTISSLHAVIEYRDGFFCLEDQRSKNKTRLNGEEIAPFSPQKLKNGDIIMINIYKFIFILPDQIPVGGTIMDFFGESASAAPASGKSSLTPQAILIDIKNITKKKTIPLLKTHIKIGRDTTSDIIIAQNSISGSHAIIEFKDGFFYVEDQRSTNKTFLNGTEMAPYSPMKIKSGDEIMFDVYKFIILLEGQAPTGDTGQRWPDA